ncbi:BlaI/MecI/CopY family transcriptional regulator [Streptomyces sp. NPDC007084]|uniref:BlaI/MecI/CopY family transcriptional regulator n=1 Tax=Streptomyces sp. NPDC007084 TaxID=3154313 RepID=UPI00345584D4
MPESLHLLREYARRLHADLDANTSERRRLRDGLHRLEQEHHVLMNVQITLNSGAAAMPPLTRQQRDAPGLGGEHGVVPFVMTERALVYAHPMSGHRGGRRPGERALIDVVSTLLREHGEPCSVAQIRRAVVQTRPTTEQTVRNTLDRLVATGKAERTTRGRSVFYSAVCPLGDERGVVRPEGEAALGQGEKRS